MNIYLDCPFCDLDYFRSQFTIVNYVNDRYEADVHIMVSRLETGSGGSEYHMVLVGRGRYVAHRDTLVFSLPPHATTELTRSSMLDYLQKGLLPYIMKTPLRDKVMLAIDQGYPDLKVSDPWDNWMFRISGGGSCSSEKYYKDLSALGRLYINKTTDQMKLEINNAINYSQSTFYLDDTEPMDSSEVYTSYSLASSLLYVKSLGEHCGLGGVISAARSTYYNMDYQISGGPAVEFNIYKYSEATERQFRFLYSIQYEHSRYLDTTIYGRLNDELFSHQLNIVCSYYKDWGNVIAYAYGNGYLNDLAKYSAGAGAAVSISLARGFSVDLSVDFSYCQDQISLADDELAPGEFYGRTKQFATDFNYGMSLGISYRFGSIFNNAVNPRFDF